ncbi:MAG: hypothetical protein KFF68_16755 [Desulfosarcina sp.]|nr:hypothetical protein [Desulfosarcina sp.]
MASITADENRKLAQTIEQRAGTGPSEIVAGWQAMLQDMLSRMQPFLKPGSIVTFQQLLSDEKVFFKRLTDEVAVPEAAQAFYLPPSVRHQMMGGSAGGKNDIGLSDAGVLVASRIDNHDVIVNALFARASCTPAVDVYEQGHLVAGYQYPSIDACRSELGTILKRHLLQSSMRHQ